LLSGLVHTKCDLTMLWLTYDDWARGGFTHCRNRELAICLVSSLASLGVGLYLWLRHVPPWFLASRYGAANIRRLAWDRHKEKEEASARLYRRNIRLLLIRHGESQANTNLHVVGGRDVGTPLTEKGERQAHQLGRRFHQEFLNADAIYSSHAVRAKRTAEIACQAMGVSIDRIQVAPDVVEFSQGSLEKQSRAEVYRTGGPVDRALAKHSMFFRPPGYSPDGDRGESQHDVDLRLSAFFEKLLPPQGAGAEQRFQKTVLVFTHGVAIKSFLRGVLGAKLNFAQTVQIDHTSVTELLYQPKPGCFGGWNLIRVNDSAHTFKVDDTPYFVELP